MKKAETIIEHLFATAPQKFSTQRAIENLTRLLPPVMQEAIIFSYIRGSVLTFVLNNPALVTEFNYKQKLIKLLLKEFVTLNPSTPLAPIETLKCYYKPMPVNTVSVPWYEKVSEKSDGTFVNHADDPAVYERIEAIRKAILSQSP